MLSHKMFRLLRESARIAAGVRTDRRSLTVSVIGAASNIGQNVALFLKQNLKIEKLKLYDEDKSLPGIVLDLQHIPNGPCVSGYGKLEEALQCSELIAVVARTPRKLNMTREQTFTSNADMVVEVATAIAKVNPQAFLAVSTNPINAILPLFSSVLDKHNAYNPLRVFGVTNIDTLRSRTFAAQMLQLNPRFVDVPVVGGHSDETIIPLFSRMVPECECLDEYQIDCLTKNVRFAGTDVVNNKAGTDSATISMAWAIHEFLDGLINALQGFEIVQPCYTANVNYGTAYFAGPTSIGKCGITQTCSISALTKFEGRQMDCAIAALKKDVAKGEGYGMTKASSTSKK